MVSQETRDGWSKKIKAIIQAKQEKLLELNNWEWDFILNVEYRQSHGRDLSMQQSITLNNIYRRVK